MIEKLVERKLIKIDKVLCEFSKEYHAQSSKKLRKEYEDWKNTLTKEEINILRKYRLGTFAPSKRNINAYLRSACLNDDVKNDEVLILEGTLSKARLTENIATYRTISRNEYEFLRQFKINDEFVNRDFKGTHVTQRIYKNTTAAYVIYLIPKGYECAYINHWIAIFMFEKELLLNRGSKCRVVGIKKVFGKECYILKLI